jgi:hypothetical protein
VGYTSELLMQHLNTHKHQLRATIVYCPGCLAWHVNCNGFREVIDNHLAFTLQNLGSG